MIKKKQLNQRWYLLVCCNLIALLTIYNFCGGGIGSSSGNLQQNYLIKEELAESIKLQIQNEKDNFDELYHLKNELKTVLLNTPTLKKKNQQLLPPSVVAADHHEITSKPKIIDSKVSTVMVVFCYNRESYLKTTLDSILESLMKAKANNDLQNIGLPTLLISQDGRDSQGVMNLAKEYVDKFKQNGFEAMHVNHERDSKNLRENSYFKLASHYKFGISESFKNENIKRVIILEDDLQLALDFFSYMNAVAPLVDEDEKVLAASAWNDHGQKQFVTGADPKSILRTDFFGGLGWMLSKRIWKNELEEIWPKAYWDDWLREPARRKDRHILRPEISRTVTFGAQGTSNGQFYHKYLQTMQVNTEYVDFKSIDIKRLLNQEIFHRNFMMNVESSKLMKSIQELRDMSYGYTASQKSFKISYNNDEKQYVNICNQLGLINDIKAHVPRGAYHGIVPLFFNSHRLFIVP